jgi:hypothetical protein
MAAELIQKQPAAIQLRYLQTLIDIGAQKLIVFPLPVDILTSINKLVQGNAASQTANT